MHKDLKYKVGDTVYFLFDDKFKRSKVEDVIRSVYDPDKDISYLLKGDEYEGYHFGKHELFGSLDELKRKLDDDFDLEFSEPKPSRIKEFLNS